VRCSWATTDTPLISSPAFHTKKIKQHHQSIEIVGLMHGITVRPIVRDR